MMKINVEHFIFKASLLIILFTLVCLLYMPGISGSFYYDDMRPLSALTKVHDVESSLIYVFSETSGPLGRPIAMLSFLWNVGDWPTANSPGNSSAFFIFNIILHTLNGLLVFVLSYLIALLYKGHNKSNFWLALITAALWLVLPILASTSLIAIQRMAGLSAFFVLSGLSLYLLGLYKQSLHHQENKNSGLWLQLTGLIVFTLLAMFTKENGILLPIFALVLEATLLAKVTVIEYRRKLRLSSCGLGLLVIIGYLAFFAFTSDNVLSGRGYTLIERLLTQPQILVDYLRLAFIPDITSFSPFHDNYKHVESAFSSVKTTISICLVLIVFVSSIAFRQRFPLFAFGVLWFLTAHLLESSVLNLELYFEHRNYIALIGPCLALIFSYTHIPDAYKRIAIISFSLYWLILTICLLLTTQLWGNKQQAAEAWWAEDVASSRAAEHISIMYFNKGEPEIAQIILDKHLEYCPDCASNIARSMFFLCLANEPEKSTHMLNELARLIPQTKRTNGISTTLRYVLTAVKNGDCENISIKNIEDLNHALLQAPDSPFNEKIGYIQNLYQLALDEKNKKNAINFLYMAWEEQQDSNIAKELVAMLLAQEQYEAVSVFVEKEVCNIKYYNPILASKANSQCSTLKQHVDLVLKNKKRIKHNETN